MNIKWIGLGSSVLLAVGAWVLIQEPNANQEKDLTNPETEIVSQANPQFTKELKKEVTKKVLRSIKIANASMQNNKNITDLYKSYRNEDITLSDANEVEQILNDMLLSQNSKNVFILDNVVLGTKGSTYYKFQQTYDGLNVYGSQVSVQVSDASKLQSILGKYASKLTLDTTPSIKGTEALQSSLNALSNGDTSAQKVYQEPTLIVYMDYNDNAHLAYESVVKYNDVDGKQQIDKLFTDANTAEVIETITNIHTARDIRVHSLNGNCIGRTASLPGPLARYTDQAVGDTSVDNTYDYLNDTYHFFKHMFNRHSYDANDARLVATVDATFQSNGSCTGVNAYFSPQDRQLVFGTGGGRFKNFARAQDVVAHEFVHAFTWRTSNLEYRNESGALNESISDIFGVSVQAWAASGGNANGNPSEIIIENDTWVMGEDVGLYRYLNNPTKDGQSPDNYNDRYIGTQDNGGVHTNSGITNLSFALLAEGGTHPRNKTDIEVPGIGIDKAVRIWYEAQTTTMSTRSNFRNIRGILANAASSLYEECSPEYKAVQLSLDAVKIPGSWECIDTDTTAPKITSILPSNGATDLLISTIAKVTFNEPMDRTSLNRSNIFLTDSNGENISGSISINGQVASFKPSIMLKYETTYTFTISTGVSDAVGNTLLYAKNVSFTTMENPTKSDTIAPSIVSITPQENATDVEKDSAINVNFSEAIKSTSFASAFTLSTQAGKNVNGSVSVSGSNARFTPSANLMANTIYTAALSTNLKDISGNTMSSSKAWRFRTKADPSVPVDSDISLINARVSASSKYNYSYGVENIRDGRGSSYWVSQTNYWGNNQEEWVRIDLDKVSDFKNMNIYWYGGYYPRTIQLWGKVNGSWKKLKLINKNSPGTTSISVNEKVDALFLGMRGGRYGRWFIIKELTLD